MKKEKNNNFTPDNIYEKRLLEYVFKYKKQLAVLIFSSVMLAITTSFTTILVSVFLSVVTGKIDTSDFIIKYLLKWGFFDNREMSQKLANMTPFLFMATYFLRGIFMYINQSTVGIVAAKVATNLRVDMYKTLQSLSLRFFHKGKVGDFISRMNSDVNIIQNASDIVMVVIEAPIMIVVGLTGLFIISWKLSLMVIVCVPIIGFLLARITTKIRKFTKNQQESMSEVNAKVTENLKGIRVIKSFAREDFELGKFSDVTKHNLNMTVRTVKRSALVVPSMEIVGGIAMGLLLLVGSAFVLRGYITFPKLGQYIMLAFIVANSVKSISKLKVVQQLVAAASARIFEIIDMKSDQKEPDFPKKLDKPKGEIEFKNVNFSYESNEKVIDNLSFKINPGEVVALVGSSGSGKSTIADLIPRFYDVDSGEILFDGENVKDYLLKDLREVVSIVPQDTILFSGTVRENIAYGDINASENEIIEAAKNANAHDFITAFPKGYETVLGESGTGLSGGQRQRIAIARALLRKKSKIIIMDEATSALDMESESVVQEAIERAMKGKTTVIIAHRLSTVKNADKIFVIDSGKLVESGTFNELLAQNGIFAGLYSSSLVINNSQVTGKL